MKLKIEPHGSDFRLLVDDGQAGIYGTLSGAKSGARRFISSYQHLKWERIESTPPVWIGKIS